MTKRQGHAMRPLADWPRAVRNQLTGVLTDIDDTLTTDGAITPDALQALADLKTAGLHVIAITGRPIGWCLPFVGGDRVGEPAEGGESAVAPWPVDAIVAENGSAAIFLRKIGLRPSSTIKKQLSKIYQQDSETRRKNYARMQAVAAQILRDVPGTTLSQDSPGRETDMAIDHSEFAHLTAEQIAQVVSIMHGAGMNATVSSIHINGWYGQHNKLQGAEWIVRELLGRDLQAELAQWVYMGDSTNDELMFQHFENSVGVANIRRFESQMQHLPPYITQGERGAGFAELVRSILGAR